MMILLNYCHSVISRNAQSVTHPQSQYRREIVDVRQVDSEHFAVLMDVQVLSKKEKCVTGMGDVLLKDAQKMLG